MKTIIGFLLFVLSFVLAPDFIKAQTNDCNYLLWADEFDYSDAPADDKWDYDTGGGGWGNNELQTYTNNRSNSWVEDGKLFIKAIKSGSNWTSARLITKFKGDWLYGRIEVKAKLPSGKGTWPAIWMLPTDWAYGGWPSSGEIDIMEHVGYDPGVVHGTIHTEAYHHSINTQKGGNINISDAMSDFHVYAIEWNEDEIKWFVDDQHYFTFLNEKKTFKEWPFDKRFHLLLNIAIGGSWGGAQGIDPNLNEATMEVEYVRVYQPSPDKPVINGSTYNSENSETNYSVNELENAIYEWEVPEGVELINGQASNSINVVWGNQSGNIRVKLMTECDTIYSDYFHVDYYLKPEGEKYDISPADGDDLLWTGFPGDNNSLNLSEENDELVVDFQVAEPDRSPNLVYDLGKLIDFSGLSEIAFDLAVDPNNPPSNMRIELEDLNGNINLNDLYKIDNFATDSDYHSFAYKFSENSSNDISKIRKIRIYFNYGVFGKSGSGIFKIKNLRMQTPTATNSFEYKQDQFSIFPNPTNGELTINADEIINSIRIFSSSGSIVYISNDLKKKIINISLDHLSAGLYFVKVNQSNSKKLTVF